MDALERRSRKHLARSSVGCPSGRPQTVVRDPLRLAMMRSGDRGPAKQVHMTWTEDRTMNLDKQCLQQDVTEGRCLEEGCEKNMLEDCMFLCRMVSTMQ